MPGATKQRVTPATRGGVATLAELRKSFLRYSVCVVLKRGSDNDFSNSSTHSKIIEVLVRAGLDVALLKNEDDADDANKNVVVVVSAERELNAAAPEVMRHPRSDDEGGDAGGAGDVVEEFTRDLDTPAPRMLQLEHDRLYSERYINVLSVGHHEPPALTVASLTEAKKIMLTTRIVHRALRSLDHIMQRDGGDAVSGGSGSAAAGRRPPAGGAGGDAAAADAARSVYDFVGACFPLQDDVWNDLFLTKYARTLLERRTWTGVLEEHITTTRELGKQLLKSGLSQTHVDILSGGGAATPLGRVVATGDDNGTPREPADWPIQALRAHLGERVAFYFAFNAYYTSWLIPLMAFFVVYYLIVRIAHWPTYVRGQAIFGFCVPVVWATLLIKHWRRRTASLQHQWGLMGVPESESPNPAAKYVVLTKDRSTGETFRRYDPGNNRRKVWLCMVPFLLINFLVMVVGITPFVQWYVFGRQSPLCKCCEWHQSVGRAVGNTTTFKWPTADLEECDYLRPNILTQEPPTSCTYFVNCFHDRGATVLTDRWFYILIQGILLGITLDVVQFELFVAFTVFLTRKEHWPTVAEFERRVVRKQFLFCWVNMYFWFLVLAFVFVPFGKQLQDFLVDIGLGWTVPEYGWQERNLNIDEAFVTPLVVTQSINLALETLVPFLRARAARKIPPLRSMELASLSRRIRNSSAGKRPASTEDEQSAEAPAPREDEDDHGRGASDAKESDPTPAKDSGADDADRDADAVAGGAHADESAEATEALIAGAPQANELEVEVGRELHVKATVPVADDASAEDEAYADSAEMVHVYRIRKSTGHSIRVLLQTEDANRVDAAECLRQARRSDFNPRADYLDLLMQFGYIIMFTTAWALAPVTAVINNMLEIRTDAFKVLQILRRPQPSEDSGIGEWLPAMEQSVLLALPVVAGLIVVGTGQLEWWLFDDTCHEDWISDGVANMGPDLSCIPSWGWRLLAFVVIERLGVSLVGVIKRAVPAVSPSLASELEDQDISRRRALQDSLLPSLPAGLEDDLRVVFDAFDVDGNKTLGRDELQALFTIMMGYSLPEHHMQMLLSFVDVDGSNTASFAEFALALQRAQDDFVLQQVLQLKSLAQATRALADDVRSGRVKSLEDAAASAPAKVASSR